MFICYSFALFFVFKMLEEGWSVLGSIFNFKVVVVFFKVFFLWGWGLVKVGFKGVVRCILLCVEVMFFFWGWIVLVGGFCED